MKASIVPSERSFTTLAERPAGLTDRWLRARVFARLAALRRGQLIIEDADGEHVFGEAEAGEPRARVRIVDPRTYLRIAVRGTVGAGEAYIYGWWTSDELTALMRLFARNRTLMETIERGLASLSMPLLRLYHRTRRNTREGSELNIAAHYDLGNDFYQLWLDPTMTYSCAIFEHAEWTLEQAQQAKYDRICRRLEIGPEDHVLEIGSGWGGFAIHAARRYGCQVTTTTISRAQYQLASERVRELGLDDRVTVLLEDYRELEGSFDKLVSIEMFEAVGHDNYGRYFEICEQRLKPGGAMLLQTITIAESHFEQALRSVDFIQRYIFPGGCLPSVSALARAAGEASALTLTHLEEMGLHYAETLRRWRQTFEARLENVRALGFNEAFLRMWRFYLSYCEGGFDERTIGTVQVCFQKPATS